MIAELLLAGVSTLLLVYYAVTEWRRPHNFPPGPRWWPFVGTIEFTNLVKSLGGPHLAIMELSKRYNSDIVGLKMGREKMVCTISYQTAKEILISEEFEGRPRNFFFYLRSMGTDKGITGTDGHLWKEQRNFVMSHLRTLGFGKITMENMIKTEVGQIFNKIDANLKDVDLSAILARSVLDILWTLTSGSKLSTNNKLDSLIELLDVRGRSFDMSGGLLNQYPWIRHLIPEKSGYNLILNLNRKLKEFIMEPLIDHKEKWTDGNNDDLMFAFLTEMNKQQGYTNFTDDQLIMICLDIFIAGSQTTSNTIHLLFMMMILRPDIQEKAQKSLDEAFGNNDISYQDREKVPYVEAVISEVQRYYPVVIIAGPRRNFKETYLEGYTIPQNTTVLISAYSVHHDKEYWGDPEVFRPERFLDEEGKLISHDRMIPFGLGRRRCLGEVLAKECVFIFFSEIIRRYKVEAKPGTTPGKIQTGITLHAEKFNAKLTPRF